MGAGTAAALWLLLVLAPAAAGEDSTWLISEGERWWSRSPDPRYPVACATCHHDPAATLGWAASFPKFKPLPPPEARVMTLLQANAEAVARHYRLEDPLPAATAIAAYLTALGGDLPISPGLSPGQPVFPERIEALVRSVERGGEVFARRCGACHDAAGLAPSVRAFPRVSEREAESLERFISRHRPVAPQLDWNGQTVADLMAYLLKRLEGQPLGPRVHQGPKERR